MTYTLHVGEPGRKVENVGNNKKEEGREDESNEREDVRAEMKGTKDGVDERVAAVGLAASLCAVELMTGIRVGLVGRGGDCWDPPALLGSRPALPPSQEICGNLTPFGLKSPDKTKALWLN